MNKRQEILLRSADIPNRPGWELGLILTQLSEICVIVKHKYILSIYEVAVIRKNGLINFRGSVYDCNYESLNLILAHEVMKLIDSKDTRGWDSWNKEKEGSNQFWIDLVQEIPSIMITAQILSE